MSRDARVIFVAGFVRSLGVGMTGVLLGLYVGELGVAPATLGIVVSSGLAGAAVATAAATLAADTLGRRRFLLLLGALGALGAVAAASATSTMVLAAAAFVGMLNGMGRDRGAALVLDQAMLPAAVPAERRTWAFAVYNLLQDAGHGLGSLAAALPAVLAGALATSELAALRAAVAATGGLALASAALYLLVSPAVATPEGAARARLSPQSRRIVWRISALFGIDATAGGFLTTALLSYFFFARFGVGVGSLGVLFFLARALNALSHLGAAALAKRIGLVNTMVFTHIPSSLLLVTVAFAPSFPVAAVLFLLREGLVEMDVPTRQSYVMAVVRPEERTTVSGITSLVRVGGWAVAPTLAGAAMQGVSLLAPLIAGAAMKISYDVMLYFAFRGVPPPEESA